MTSQPNDKQLAYLRENPETAPYFDQLFGQGAAADYLESWTPPEAAPVGEQEDASPGVLGTVDDIGVGIVSGATRAVQETLQAVKAGTDWIAENLTGDIVIGGENGLIEYRSPSELEENPTAEVEVPLADREAGTGIGKLTQGLTQFATGYVTGGKVLQGVKAVGTAARTGKAFAQGAVADFLAFDEQEQRLSNIINEYFPDHSTFITEYLAAKETDEFLEGRLKNVIEGGLLGVVAEGIVRGVTTMVRGMRVAKQAVERGDKEAAEKILKETREAAQKEIEADHNAEFVPPDAGTRNAAEAGDDVPGSPVAPEPDGIELPRPGRDPKVNDKLSDEHIESIVRDFDQADAYANNIGATVHRGGINPDKWVNAENALRVQEAIAVRIRESNAEAFDAVQSFETMQEIAKRYSLKPEQLKENMKALGIATKDMPSMLVATDMVLKRLGQQVSDIALQYRPDNLFTGGYLDNMPPEAVEQISGMLQAMAELYTSRGLVQKHAARTVASGRIIEQAGAEIGIDAIRGMMTAIKDEKNLEQALRLAVRHRHKPNRMVSALHSTFTGKTWDKVNEYWINALLSHPRTHILNMLSGSIETVVRPIEDAMGRAFTGDFKGAAGDIVGAYMGMKDNFRSSARFMADVMQSGNIDNMDLDRLSELAKSSPLYASFQSLMKENNILDPFHRQYDVPNHAIKGTTGKVLRTPSRFLAAEDEFMKQVNYRNKIYMEEYATGYRNGLSHKEIAENISNRMARAFQSTDDLKAGVTKGEGKDDVALQYARETTFTQDLNTGSQYALGNFGLAWQRMSMEVPALRQLTPFIRVPVNLFRHSLQRFPVLGMFQADMRRALMHGTALEKGRVLAKQVVGATAAAVAWNMAIDGELTGFGPKDPNERKALMATGWQPYSFKNEDGTYTQFNRLDPRFLVFGLIADLNESYHNIPEHERDMMAAVAVASVARNLTSKSFYSRLSQVLETMASGDEKKWDKFMKKHASSYVPNVTQLFTDDTIKEPQSWRDFFAARIPGMYVDPRRNVLGEAQHRMGALGPDSLSPIFISKQSDSPIDKLMIESGHAYALPPKTVPGTTINLLDFTNEKGQSAWDRWQELSGALRVDGKTLRETLEEMAPQLAELPVESDPNFGHVTFLRDQVITKIIGTFRKVAFEQVQDEFNLRDRIQMEKAQTKATAAGGRNALQDLLNH